ncbi:MAG: hypothetical protein SNF33_00525 [Candidatus Algichlamydia australiensis]|nr:hypothetical protein [Chlamydiales bacterium]
MDVQLTGSRSSQAASSTSFSTPKNETVSKINSLCSETLRKSSEEAQTIHASRSTSSLEEGAELAEFNNLPFPEYGDHFIQTFVRWARSPYVESLFELQKKLPYIEKLNRSIVHFSQLFSYGQKLLIESADTNKTDTNKIEGKLSFDVNSARDLANFNSYIMSHAEHYLSKKICPEDPDNMNHLRLFLTNTKFLDPLLLSKMTENKISVDDAELLITCLAFKENNNSKKLRPLLNLKTGEYLPGLKSKKLKLNNLIFLEPSNPIADNELLNFEKEIEISKKIYEKTKEIVCSILKELRNTSPNAEIPNDLRENLIAGAINYKYIIPILENFEKDANYSVTDIKTKYDLDLKEIEKLEEGLKTEKQFEEETKKIDAQSRFFRAMDNIDHLKNLFDEFKIDIFNFICTYSKTKINANSSSLIKELYEKEINWNIQGTQIKEVLKIGKSGDISRRVYCPSETSQKREDLPYRKGKNNDISILSKWDELKKLRKTTDAFLAKSLLKLYQGEDCGEDYKPLLPFLVILILGKEPAYDTASIAANYIMLLSVELGIWSFKEAIDKMPLVPQGAIAGKQFLLHVSNHPLDTSAKVKYKRNSKVPKSVFLVSSGTFIGSARNSILAYREVATTAMQCCRHLLSKSLIGHDESIEHLKRELKNLLNCEEELEIWDIPHSISTFSEEKSLLNESIQLEEKNLLEEKIAEKNKIACDFLTSCKEDIEDHNGAAEQCARFLMRDINPQNDRIQELRRITYEEDLNFENDKILSILKNICSIENSEMAGHLGEFHDDLPDPYAHLYGPLESAIQNWDPITVFQKKDISLDKYSVDSIKKMNEAWKEYFTDSMTGYTEDLIIKKLLSKSQEIYRVPPLFYRLPRALNPIFACNSERDPLTDWAISYILKKHPLSASDIET